MTGVLGPSPDASGRPAPGRATPDHPAARYRRATGAPIRIVLLVDDPEGGTYGNQARRLAAGLAGDPRARCRLLAYGDHPDDPGVDRLRARRALTSGPALVRYLVEQGPDVLVTHQVHMNLVAVLAARWARRRGWAGRLVIGHDHPIALSHRENRRDNRHAARLLYRHADLVMAPSPTVADDAVVACGVRPERVLLVPCAIDRATHRHPPDHPWFSDGDPVFLTVGRLVGYKRVELAIDAVLALGGPARLAVIGVGPHRAALVRHVERRDATDRVALLGFVADPRVYMEHATGVVLASDEEGFSQVLAEAMSVGCPVVSTDAWGGGPRFVTDDGRHGLLVPRDDADALAAALRVLLDPAQRARWARRALARAGAFSPERCAALLLEGLGVSRATEAPTRTPG